MKPSSNINGLLLVLIVTCALSADVVLGTVYSSDSVPIAGISVSLNAGAIHFGSDTTGPDGSYRVDNVPSGERAWVEVEAPKNDFYGDHKLFDLSTQSVDTVDFYLDAIDPSLSGNIVGTVVDSTGNPFEGALVTVVGDSGTDSVVVGTDGKFQFIDLQVGIRGWDWFDVTATYDDSYVPAIRPTQLHSGETDTVNLTLLIINAASTAAVFGTVEDSLGNPLESAMVKLILRDRDYNNPNPVVDSMMTGPEGSYLFDSVIVDPYNDAYNLTVEIDGYLNGNGYAWLTKGETDTVNFALGLDPTVGIIGNIQEILTLGLEQNIPNPFNPVTSIKFHIPNRRMVSLTVYDINGRMVTTLVKKNMSAGTHAITWDAREASSGMYYYIMKADDFRSVRSCLMVK